MDAIRNALAEARDQLSSEVLRLAWGSALLSRDTSGLTLKLRPWPNTSSMTGPQLRDIHGATDTEAWLNAWLWAKEHPNTVAGG